MQSTFVCLAALFAHVQHACAQTVVNGQIFTNGLAIIDAPASNSSLHAGSTIQVAIDVSGDGKLSQSASIPGSSQSTRFDSLEIYLVSYQKSQNLTVSSGPGLLTRESGSTVKHWNYNVSTCVPAGSYNLTFYEGSHIDGQAYFSITPIPIEVINGNPSGACSEGTNTLQDYPQLSSSPPQSPWLSSTASGSSVFPSSTGTNSSPNLDLSVHTLAALLSTLAALLCIWV